jgi:hypothetical protein
MERKEENAESKSSRRGYHKTCLWMPQDKQKYLDLVKIHGKDFLTISKNLPGKSV